MEKKNIELYFLISQMISLNGSSLVNMQLYGM